MSITGSDLYTIAEIQLSYKPTSKASAKPQIREAEEAYELLLSCWDENKLSMQEQCKVIFLSQANRVIGICDLSTGGLTGTVVDLRLVFATALKSLAASIILAHNHPSENREPSHADRAITEKAREAGRFLDIKVLDHIIVTADGYYSFANEVFFETYQVKPVKQRVPELPF